MHHPYGSICGIVLSLGSKLFNAYHTGYQATTVHKKAYLEAFVPQIGKTVVYEVFIIYAALMYFP